MVKSKPSNRAKGARRARRNSRKNVQGENQNRPMSGMSRPQGVAAAYSRRVQSMAPQIVRTANGCRIRHRELVAASLAGSTTFTVQTALALNPGLAGTFPWLAPQAQQCEEYTCHALRGRYVPIAPTNTAGDVIVSPEYNASAPTPTTEVQMSDNADTVEDSCWTNIVCTMQKSAMHPMGPRKYVRPCAVAGDIKTFDVGKLYVATNNEANTNAVGKLWLEYDFEFFKPQNSPSPATFPQQTSLWTNGSAENFTNGNAKAVVFDTLVFDPLNFGPPVAGVYTPPAGAYRIAAHASFTDSANETFGVTLFFQKNGATITNTQNVTKGPGVAGADTAVSVESVVVLNGTDTFDVAATLTGAAGTLQLVGGTSQLIISLA